MWGLARTFPILIVFAVVYGFSAAGYTAIWARMSTAITNDVTAAPIVFSLLNFGKGIGNVLAGPVGGFLVSSSMPTGPSSLSYRWIIVFNGVCMFASACTIFLQYSKYLHVLVVK